MKILYENLFRYTKNKNNFIDHLYDNLLLLVAELNCGLINFQDGKHDYICYLDKDKKKYIEGFYSVVDLDLLYEKIISNDNFGKDDFFSPDENIAWNAFKSRALFFEYYINNEIILTKMKAKERPRVIYFFKQIDEIKNLTENKNQINDNNDSYQQESGIIEVDGVIFEEKIEHYLDKSLFIVDQSNKFDFLTDKNNNKILENYHFEEIEKSMANLFFFKKRYIMHYRNKK